LPLAYLKGIIVKFQFLFNKNSEISIFQRVFTLVVFIFLGPIIVFLNFSVDLAVFIIHLYQKNISYRKEKSKIQYISSSTYSKLQNKLKSDSENKVEVIGFLEMSEYTRSMIKVIQLLQSIIFAKEILGLSLERKIFLLQEYGKLKETLESGSVRFGSQKLIFVSVWKNILHELKINSKIRRVVSQSKEIDKRSRVENLKD
jgi:hypothetical protein